jgi:hypothetical protein
VLAREKLTGLDFALLAVTSTWRLHIAQQIIYQRNILWH